MVEVGAINRKDTEQALRAIFGDAWDTTPVRWLWLNDVGEDGTKLRADAKAWRDVVDDLDYAIHTNPGYTASFCPVITDGVVVLRADMDDSKHISAIKPTMLVASSGVNCTTREHAYYVLDAPTHDYERVKALQTRYAVLSGTSDIAFHKDLSRCLRLPGAPNRKPGREEGARCTVVFADGPRWSLDTFDAAMDAFEQEEYRAKVSAEHFYNRWLADLADPDLREVPTGLGALDDALGGGLRPGLTVLGAVSSAGKTTLSLQIASTAAEKRDVFVFSVEMAGTEIVAKMFQRFVNATAEHTMSLDEIGRRARDGLAIFGKPTGLADFLKSIERVYVRDFKTQATVDDVRDTVSEHIRITKNKPLVFIDYLQLLGLRNEKFQGEKQRTDAVVSALRQYAADTQVPIFAISTLNRASYMDPVTLSSFKESGAIEYGADVLLGLDFEAVYRTQRGGETQAQAHAAKMEEMRDARRQPTKELRLTVLKNRMGKAGAEVSLRFDALRGVFEQANVDGFTETQQSDIEDTMPMAWRF